MLRRSIAAPLRLLCFTSLSFTSRGQLAHYLLVGFGGGLLEGDFVLLSTPRGCCVPAAPSLAIPAASLLALTRGPFFRVTS